MCACTPSLRKLLVNLVTLSFRIVSEGRPHLS
jgi:hypothetical protein